MKMMNLVAAVVLRVRAESVLGAPISWKVLGEYFSLSDDAIRHRVSTFRKKFHIVDDDLNDLEWNRNFLREHATEEEKVVLNEYAYWPGDAVKDGSYGLNYIIYDLQEGMMVGIGHNGIDFNEEYLEDWEIDDGETTVAAIEEDLPVNQQVMESIAEDIPEPKFLVTPSCLVVIRNEMPLTIDKSHKNYERIKTALNEKKWGLMFDLIDMKNTITKFSSGRVTVENGLVQLDGENVDGKIVNRLVNLLLEENMEQLDALAKFLEKLDDNPDNSVVTRIYDFMQANDIRIHKDGDILCYKRVVYQDGKYLDTYTRTIDNAPGQIVTMKRNKVNRNDHETCSHGLHVASFSYMNSYSGDRILICKVNPADIVSIPTDYNNAKMRVCRYEVLKDVSENHTDDIRGLSV